MKKKNVLILIPENWYIEECCVKTSSHLAPTGALLLAAYLRQQGHYPRVLVQSLTGKSNFSLNAPPDALVVFAPWNRFFQVGAPIFKAFKNNFPECSTILVMYESLADFELQAMKSCLEIDYAVLPNEKEISVGVILEHGESTCPDGFGEKAGIAYRDADGEPKHDGVRIAQFDLLHLPYSGDELLQFIRSNPHQPYSNHRVLFQRGCPQTCVFCPMRCTRARYRDPETVVRELNVARGLFGRFGCGVMSHEAFKKPEKLDELANNMIASGVDVEWDIGARCDFINNPDLLKKLKTAGLRGLYLGIEAATEESRKRLMKPISDDDLERTLKLIRDADLGFYAAIIIGFPWENDRSMQTTREFIGRVGILPGCVSVRLSQLIPYPGLPVEEMMVTEGILPDKISLSDWNYRDQQLAEKYSRTKYLDRTGLDAWFDALVAFATEKGCYKPEWIITQVMT